MKLSTASRIHLVPLILLLAFANLGGAQTQMEMNEEAAAEFSAADARLNTVYQDVLKSIEANPFQQEALRAAQRSWLKYVELHMQSYLPIQESENPREVHGSIYPLLYFNEKSRLFEQRIALLQDFQEAP